ncbi:MAG: AMP-binding protein, partial [Planctomycetes bacterium]|nr:AMP-binding protein [Planctomycetota bacterium]
MKSIEAFLSQLHNLKVKVWAENEELCYKAPKGVVTKDLLAEIVERKTEILAFLRQAALATRSHLPPIEPFSRERDIPLSFAQQRLWFLDRLEGKNATAYNMPADLRLEGPLHRAALSSSLQEIIQRHETLRTTFSMKDEKPVQVIHQSVNNDPLTVVDLQGLSSVKQGTEIQKLAEENAQRPFDLSKGPLFSAVLLQLGINSHILLLTMHHIISDGWSMEVFISEFSALYEAFLQEKSSPLEPLPIQYADFSLWQRQWLSGEALQTQLNYWQQKLADATHTLEIPGDHPRPPVYTFNGGAENIAITPELTRKLTSLSQQTGDTLFMTTLAAFAMLLSRYSGMEDIVIGSPIANRTRKETEPLIGLFVNTLALRIDLSGNPTFLELLARVRKTTLESYDHQDLPFEQVVEALQPKRDMSRNPLAQVAFAYQNVPQSAFELPNMAISPVEFETHTVRMDLEFHIWEVDGGLECRLLYYKDIFEAATIKRLLGGFHTLLTSIAENPGRPVLDYSLLSKAEQHKLLVEWNSTETNYPSDKCIHQLFEAQAEGTPDAVAVVFNEQQLTYRELNTRSNQLAHHLQTLGVEPEMPVGISVARSAALLIGWLGILKSGGAYLFLESSTSAKRLA